MPRRGDYRVGDQGWWTEMEIRLLWIKHSYLYFTDLQEFVGTLLRSLFAASPVLLIASKRDGPLFNYILLSSLTVQVRDFTVNSQPFPVVIISLWLFNLHLSVPMLNTVCYMYLLPWHQLDTAALGHKSASKPMKLWSTYETGALF